MNKQQIMTVLRPIKDPFIHKRFVETDAIRDILLDEEEGAVDVVIALSQLTETGNRAVREEINDKLSQLGIKTVRVEFLQMAEEKLRQFPQYKLLKSPLLNSETTSFIAIASGKGGVGKSTVTVNLAVHLAQLGYKVGVIDADIYGFSVPRMMNITKKPTLQGNMIIPATQHGVKVMSMDFFVEDNDPVIWRGPRLAKILTSFFTDVLWGELDYLLIDLPPGTGDMALNVHQILPSSKEIIVTTPHKTAAEVALRAGKMAQTTNHKVIGVVENMAYFECVETEKKVYVFGKGGGDYLAEALGAPLLISLPLLQPVQDEKDVKSIYERSEKSGKLYSDLAKEVVRLANDSDHKG